MESLQRPRPFARAGEEEVGAAAVFRLTIFRPHLWAVRRVKVCWAAQAGGSVVVVWLRGAKVGSSAAGVEA